MSKKKVLIFGGGSYAASQIYYSLKTTMRYYPILASSNDNHSVFICNDAITDLPYDSAPDFVDKLNECIEKTGAEFLIPTHDTAAVRIMENKDRINAVIVCSPLETAKICRYKSLTYKVLSDFDFVPKIYDMANDNIEYPIFAKDDVGQGGRNSYLINSKEQLDNLSKSSVNYVLCEYLPKDELTVDCFTDRHGNLRFIQPRKRERLLNGITARTSNIELTDEIKYIVESISSRIKFRGYWYVQLKADANGRYKLMEISTRFAGTFGLSRNLDVNLPLLALRDFENEDIDIAPNKYDIKLDKMYIDRYIINYDYKRVYIDFDDTLVFERKKYNTEALRFLFQCLNKGISLVLITKHAYDIRETAKNIRFDLNIFDEIIEVPIDEPKYKYMDNNIKSIYIDKAYAERKKVKEFL